MNHWAKKQFFYFILSCYSSNFSQN